MLDVKRSSASPNHEATQESKALIEKVTEMIPEMEKENDIALENIGNGENKEKEGHKGHEQGQEKRYAEQLETEQKKRQKEGQEEEQREGHGRGEDKRHEEGQIQGQEKEENEKVKIIEAKKWNMTNNAAANVNCDDNNEDKIVIIGVTQGTGQIEKRKKRKMDVIEEKAIANGAMLSDISINIAQNLLHNQFPTCRGLEDTTLGTYLQYSICKGEFAQILFTGNQHWICASNIGCKKGEVNIYDSSSGGNVTNHVKKQVAAILLEEGQEITLNIKSVQQQQNGTDCGVFSIAFLTSLLHGHDPSTKNYRNNELRSHLLPCITNGYVTPFPEYSAAEPNVKKCNKETKVVVELFCTCRMPWESRDAKKKETQMASCAICHKWYHHGCENIPDLVFKKQSFWQCSQCAL